MSISAAARCVGRTFAASTAASSSIGPAVCSAVRALGGCRPLPAESAAWSPSGSSLAPGSAKQRLPTRDTPVVGWNVSGRLVASRMGLLAGRVWAPEHEAGRSGRAGIRSMCGEATQAAEEAAPESATGLGKDSGLFDPKKQRYRGNNLFDILRQLNYHGVGWRVSRNPWIRKYPDSYWVVHRVVRWPYKRAWGQLVWKGKMMYEGKVRRIRSSAKRQWRYLGEHDGAIRSSRIPGDFNEATKEANEAQFARRAAAKAAGDADQAADAASV